jgi:predicted metal-dependent hydrolase
VGLTHSIRRRGKGWVIRVSDHCQDAPRAVLEAIVSMLACKILRRKSPRGAVRAYEAFRADPAVQEAVRRRRRERGYKRLRREPGTHHSLEEILQEVNRSQFHGQIEIDRVGWGVHASWSRLGHYDPVHQSITISPVLDSPKVPEYVVSYILFHELLHALFEGRETGGLHHTPEFRKAEKAYPDYAAAQDFLRRFVRNRGSWPGSS